jgi:glycosidase
MALLHAFNFAIPGIPVIYYGDEYGMPGANDPDNRRQMQFEGLDENERILKAQVKEMAALRENNLALIYGTTDAEVKDNGLLVIKRKYFENEVWVAFNNSSEPLLFDESIEGFTSNFGDVQNQENGLLILPYSFYFLVK